MVELEREKEKAVRQTLFLAKEEEVRACRSRVGQAGS
jgi:hypothetical protein